MLSMVVSLMLQAAAPAPTPMPRGHTPTPAAEALGREIAANGTIVSILPMVAEKDLADLAGDKSLTEANRAELMRIGRAEAASGIDRLVAAMGRSLATRLSEADLRIPAAQAREPAVQRLRAAQPVATMEALKSLGEIDLKKNVAAAFCKARGKLCDRD